MSRSKQSKTYFNSDVKISVGLCLDPYIAKLISTLMPNSALDKVEAETRLFEAQAAQNVSQGTMESKTYPGPEVGFCILRPK